MSTLGVMKVVFPSELDLHLFRIGHRCIGSNERPISASNRLRRNQQQNDR
jgi:hypothetical protein